MSKVDVLDTKREPTTNDGSDDSPSKQNIENLNLKASKQTSLQVQRMVNKITEKITHIESNVCAIEKAVDKQNDFILDTTGNITREFLEHYREDFQEHNNRTLEDDHKI